MAKALEEVLGPWTADGAVVVPYGHGKALKRIELLEAGHPVPDRNGLVAARKLMALAETAEQRDLVICLLSGGASALMPLPAGALSLEDKQDISAALLTCGAAIHEINTVRKHLSAIKGGRLAAAVCPARLVSLAMSDVVGDNAEVIASGPTVPDPGTFQQSLEIIERFALGEKIPQTALAHLKSGAAGEITETPEPGDGIFKNARYILAGCNMDALKEAARKAQRRGWPPVILSDTVAGEACDAAAAHAALIWKIKAGHHSVHPPVCLLSGGETTVTVKGNGKGGRNQEFCLKCAMDIDGADGVVVMSAGTDGTDGPTDAAGAVVDAATVRRGKACGLDPGRYLENNNAYPFLEKTGDLFTTGPTLTNVMDVRIILIKSTINSKGDS